ncbi:hypothetical protein [Kitasatospora griseola]|uniref:hypothetical protein n=1 Tax=Kitasatospora griseola TaxID=2064 RepID=UPI0037FC139D
MRRTALAAATVGIALIVTGCSSSSTTTPPPAATGAAPAVASNPAPAKQQLDAAAALAALTAHASTITLVKAYTADTDPNHLLGRPGQYTSKVAFKDSRIKAEDAGQEEDAVIRGGSIEVFTSATDAAARAAYLEKVTKAMPALVEYDYVVRETAVLRVSQRLSPDQAKALAEALKG